MERLMPPTPATPDRRIGVRSPIRFFKHLDQTQMDDDATINEAARSR